MFVVYKSAVIKRIGQSWTKIKIYCPNLQYLSSTNQQLLKELAKAGQK